LKRSYQKATILGERALTDHKLSKKESPKSGIKEKLLTYQPSTSRKTLSSVEAKTWASA